MNRAHIPIFVRERLDGLERAVEHLTEQLARCDEAIATARARMSGGFTDPKAEEDVRAGLMDLVASRPLLQKKLGRAKAAVQRAKSYLAELPDDARLESVSVQPNGADRSALALQLQSAEQELALLRSVPMPSSDIKQRVEAYIAEAARPRVTGVGPGQTLDVTWPEDVFSLLALLSPEQMTRVLLDEVKRQADVPLPLDQRKGRIAALEHEVDGLQRQLLAIDPDTPSLPGEVLLGVRVRPPDEASTPEPPAQRIARRVRATA
jgi:hypothetical protein